MLPALIPLIAAAATFTPQVSHQVVNPDTGAVKLETGLLSQPLVGNLTQAARGWALANRQHSGLPATADLKVGPAFRTAFGASFHFQQVHKGLEVYGAEVIVTIDAQHRVVRLGSSAAKATRVFDAYAFDATEAKRRAGAAIPFSLNDGAGVPQAAVKKQLFPVGDELHAGYLLWVPSLDRMKNWYVGVDAVTGDVLFTQDRMYYGAQTANAWPVSPGGLDAGASTTPTIKVELTHADGGTEILPNDGGFLVGDQIDATNCCVNQGCDPDAGMKRVDGGANFMGTTVIYDTVLCDRLQRASNVTNPAGSYEYTPVDPPANKAVVEASDPANQDEYAEVHSFYHVNQVYDWLRGLSSNAAVVFPGDPNIVPFQMRDEKMGKKPLIWSNVLFPNFNEILNNPACLAIPPCRINSLTRVDNAAFMPVENFDQIPIPEFNPGVDTLMIFQGNNADAAYDSTVIQHEFGHGAVYATANLGFDTIAMDTRSANNESGALHEGFADYIAGAFNNLAEVGPYFGPRAAAGASAPGVSTDSYLRTLDNNFKCPDVLWGEVHQDSQHVSAALWKARTTVFAGNDGGHTFDTAFYAMLVSIPPTADFATVAAAMSQAVATAFPSITDASAQMNAIWDEKGVTNCSKVLDPGAAFVTRPYFGIAPADATLRNAIIPGPFQIKLTTVDAPVAVRVVGQVSSGGIIPGQAPPIQVMVRRAGPITFTRNGNNLNSNAEQVVPFTPNNGALDGTVTLCPGGTGVWIALGSTGGGGAIQNLNVQANAATTGCGIDDGGVDAGVDTDAGTGTTTMPGVGAENTIEGKTPAGCGCTVPVDVAPVLGLAMLALLRRRAKKR